MIARPIQLAAVLAASALWAVAAGDGLAFEGLGPAYDTAADVRFTVRNLGDSPLWLDSFQADMIVVERRKDHESTWETGYNWRCANAGVGTPRMIRPGGILEVDLLKSSAFHMAGGSSTFETKGGQERPVPGRYRIVVRYSRREWSDLAHVPKPQDVLEVVSREFVIEHDG